MPSAPASESELEDALSTPTPGVLDTLRRHPGDIVVLGAGGKMGPSLSRMLKRGLDAIGSPARVIAVSRFSSADSRRYLEEHGVETHPADLLDPDAVRALPDAHNVIYMAGQKFGTQGTPSTTWAMNAIVPALCAERYAGVPTVAFSTGNVYPLSSVESAGPNEDGALGPVGEYAMSCLARERVFDHFSRSHGTRVAIVRLNYAIDLRYGVLVDVARKIWNDEPISLTMGYANVIWQGDANARAIQCLDIASSPACAINLTGAETLSIRHAAGQLGLLLGKAPRFEGVESTDALLSNAARSFQLFGPLTIDTAQLLGWVAAWIRRGGRLLGKPTKFESRDGKF